MTLDGGSTDVLDLHLSQVDEAPRRRRRAGWVLGGALGVVAVVVGVGVAAVVPHRSSTPPRASSSAAASPTAEGAAPASSAGGPGTRPAEGPVIAQAGLQHAGHPAALLTVGTGKPVTGQAPPVVNFNECGTDGTEMEYLPVEIRDPLGGLAAAVTVLPGPTTPPGIGRLGFFFESHNGEALPCQKGAAWPTTDTFEAPGTGHLVTGYLVLDHAVTAATPHGRPDVFGSLQLRIWHLRQFVDYNVPQPLSVDPPTAGQLCPGDQDAVCAPLG